MVLVVKPPPRELEGDMPRFGDRHVKAQGKPCPRRRRRKGGWHRWTPWAKALRLQTNGTTRSALIPGHLHPPSPPSARPVVPPASADVSPEGEGRLFDSDASGVGRGAGLGRLERGKEVPSSLTVFFGDRVLFSFEINVKVN